MTLPRQPYDYTCPECGGQMVQRTNGETRKDFFGCTMYPACTGTRDLNGSATSEDGDFRPGLESERWRNADKRRWRHE